MSEVWTKELIEQHLKQGSREPFQDSLARLLSIVPDPDALQAFANKAPDRHAQAVAIHARLAGYTDKLELGGALGVLDLARLSDAELHKRLVELQTEMAALPEKTHGGS